MQVPPDDSQAESVADHASKFISPSERTRIFTQSVIVFVMGLHSMPQGR